MFGHLNLLAALFFIGTLKDFRVAGLRLTEVRIPMYVIKGTAAQLECLYDLDGEALYSVKWYKDGNEFYRYVPRDMPPAQTFLLPGVNVDVSTPRRRKTECANKTSSEAGTLRCALLSIDPHFAQKIVFTALFARYYLPDEGSPKISGGRPRYQIGDYVRVNCTAGRSKPAVKLSWQVNGEPVEQQKLRKYDTIVSGRDGLETSVLGLQFRVEQKHFRKGNMKLKCIAELSTVYWRCNEESVEGDRPQKAPVLESRETVYASNSRADPVQGTSYRELFVTKILSLLFVQTNAASSTASAPSTPITPLVLLPVALAVMVMATLAQGIARDIDTDKISMDRTAPGGIGITKGAQQARELLAGREEENRRTSHGKSATQLEKMSLTAR
ncbi:GD21879 [Drosophila simulans]|uniref:GD21879 n=1 Tax=Drosophila simulans TaxID=7240 RepID=B4Q7W6_DROSI|nr:GD21879 [Drosophila simulans]